MPIRSLIKDLQRISAVRLHNTRGIPKNLKEKMELIELAFGHAAVMADFEQWCEENAERNPPYPVSDYIRLIDGRLGAVSKVDPHDVSIGALQAVVYEKVGILPHSRAIRDLLSIHSAAEIEAAFAEYVLVVDEKDMKTALRAFFDDRGASAVISARAARAKKS